MAERILIGADPSAPLYVFENATIKECACILSSAMVGDELAIDQFMPVLYSAAYVQVAFVPQNSAGLITADGKKLMVYPGTGFLDKLPYGTPIWYYSNGVLMGKFYSQKVERTAKWYFNILAVSAVGMIDKQQHLGGVYTGQTFAEVAADIIGGSYQFSCSEDVADLPIFGWLPIATKRQNLHQLLFAAGVMLDKDNNGDVYFRYLNTDTQKNIPESRIYLGGSIDYMSPASTAEITEHAYVKIATDQTVTLFDNSDGSGEADNTFVAFTTAPVYDLEVSDGLTLVSSGVNWAVVSGTGTLTGKAYTHVTRILTKKKSGSGVEKVVSVTDATLVSIANSENVAQRVLSYYSSAKTIAADIVVADERPGDRLNFTDPYGDPASAFLGSMDINASSFLKASCELIANYVPTGQGNNYSQVVFLTGTGTFSWPANTEAAIAVLISAGSGGSSGGKGTSARNGSALSYDAVPGVGGIAGQKGAGGKILAVKLSRPSGSVNYSCGEAGVGGIATEEEVSNPGTIGGHTTFGSYNSANGVESQTGYVNLFTGEVYGLPGIDGVPGGDGSGPDGNGNNVVFGGQTWTPGKNGASYSTDYGNGDGGYGGGAAVGSNGENGSDGRANSNGGYGGSGGKGATPVKGATATQYGCGGSGGHGGGGGGNGGYGSGPEDKDRYSHGSPGAGSIGSDGGDGADGCIVIYM